MDYTAWLPGFIEFVVDNIISTVLTNHLDPEHPDAYLKVFTDSSEEDQIGSDIYRGFYADGNTFQDWFDSMLAWFIDGEIEYINGVIKDKESRDNCSVEVRNYEYKPGTFLDWTEAGWAKSRFDKAAAFTPDYHLFVRNCHHFTNWVLDK